MKKYENFCAALNNLAVVPRYHEPYDTVTMTGLVGLFEICFEQAWKMIKEILEQHGYEGAATGSPKLIIKTAYQASMIQDENKWLSALHARINVAHSYNQAVALAIINQTREQFLSMFFELKETVDKEWL